jgi:predicted DNA-binding ribbon-helix-helix protein|tara:strand:- start:4193 stop:4411 length:219 start_codon:yes stop_codon:yes gene_type:complete
MLRQRTLITPERRTSIALESVFWKSIDSISNGEWQPWARAVLKDKPEDECRATYLRTLVHKAAVTGQLAHAV